MKYFLVMQIKVLTWFSWLMFKNSMRNEYVIEGETGCLCHFAHIRQAEWLK